MQGHEPTGRQLLFFFIFGQMTFLAVNGYLLARHGQTVGKKVVGTRIVSHATGQKISLAYVFTMRYFPLAVIAQIPFAGGLFSLIDCLFIFREDRRCIHDLIAGTKVVDV